MKLLAVNSALYVKPLVVIAVVVKLALVLVSVPVAVFPTYHPVNVNAFIELELVTLAVKLAV